MPLLGFESVSTFVNIDPSFPNLSCGKIRVVHIRPIIALSYFLGFSPHFRSFLPLAPPPLWAISSESLDLIWPLDQYHPDLLVADYWPVLIATTGTIRDNILIVDFQYHRHLLERFAAPASQLRWGRPPKSIPLPEIFHLRPTPTYVVATIATEDLHFPDGDSIPFWSFFGQLAVGLHQSPPSPCSSSAEPSVPALTPSSPPFQFASNGHRQWPSCPLSHSSLFMPPASLSLDHVYMPVTGSSCPSHLFAAHAQLTESSPARQELDSTKSTWVDSV